MSKGKKLKSLRTHSFILSINILNFLTNQLSWHIICVQKFQYYVDSENCLPLQWGRGRGGGALACPDGLSLKTQINEGKTVIFSHDLITSITRFRDSESRRECSVYSRSKQSTGSIIGSHIFSPRQR